MNEERILWQKKQERVRPVGRPVVNPFHNPLVEADFYQRACMVVKRYYDFSPENTKKPFVLSPHCHMGKTAFWAFIYFYYSTTVPFRYPIAEGSPFRYPIADEIFPDEPRPLINDNLNHFLNLLKEKVGEGVVGDRTAITRKIEMYKSYPIATDEMPQRASLSFREQTTKLRRQYCLVVEIWNGSLSPALP